jgi:hypothetical protein
MWIFIRDTRYSHCTPLTESHEQVLGALVTEAAFAGFPAEMITKEPPEAEAKGRGPLGATLRAPMGAIPAPARFGALDAR